MLRGTPARHSSFSMPLLPLSALAGTTSGHSRLLVKGARIWVRGPNTGNLSRQTDRPSPSSDVDRIEALVLQIRDRILDSAKSRGRDDVQSRQLSIDTALSELSEMLGAKLSLGGAENAVVTGLNSSQIAELEVLGLPPNANATFAGSLARNSKAARTVVTDASSLLANGGSLQLDSASGETSFVCALAVPWAN